MIISIISAIIAALVGGGALMTVPLEQFGAGTTFIVQQGGTGAQTFSAGQLLYGSATNPIQTVATTSVSCAGTASCTSFTAIGSAPVTITATGGASSGNVSTSTNETAGGLAYWTSNSGTPATLGQVATGTISSGAGISVTAGRSAVGGALAITNTGVTSISATAPLVNNLSTGDIQLTCPTCSVGAAPFPFTPTAWNGFTTSATTSRIWLQNGGMASSTLYVDQLNARYATTTFASTTVGNIDVAYIPRLGNLTSNGFVTTGSSNGTLTVDTTSYVPGTRTITIAGTANQITSSAGAQDLTANRTWTLSFPDRVVFPKSIESTYATSTFASTTVATDATHFSTNNTVATSFTVTPLTSALTLTGSTGIFAEYAGTTCGNGTAATALSALGAATCTSFAPYPFTPTSNFNVISSATSTQMLFTAGISASTTVRFGDAAKSMFYWDSNTGSLGIGTTSPFASTTITRVQGAASSSLLVYEYTFSRNGNIATSTAANIDCRTANQQHWRMGGTATTLTLVGLTPGQTCRVIVENPTGTAGALTWAAGTGYLLLWAGGTAPTQTTTANKQDVWSFILTTASSTQVILGAQTANF